MPIFQDDLDHSCQTEPPSLSGNLAPPHPSQPPVSNLRRLSEESLPAELCEGPVPESPSQLPLFRTNDTHSTLDRAGLIKRLKRTQSPTWLPNQHVSMNTKNDTGHGPTTPQSPKPSNLLPAADIPPDTEQRVTAEQRLGDGLSIQRPRSALHSGDFTHDETHHGPHHRHPDNRHDAEHPIIQSSRIATSPPRDFYNHLSANQRFPEPNSSDIIRSGASPLSSSLSSSFAYQPPTSPLVQSESRDDLDFAMQLDGIDFNSAQRDSRRHTFNSSYSSPFASPSPRPFHSHRASLPRREGSFPYQAHQPRRSLSSAISLPRVGSSPQTPLSRSRRPSLGSDVSPIQHASMVGSYEESILRGRMSTTPSKPLEFLAQIGVLGKGKCKSSLRCPAHVTLGFPAVYYSYNTSSHGRSQSDDGPSPYVGQVDLENGLPNPEEEARSRKKAQSRYGGRISSAETAQQDVAAEGADTPQPKRRSASPKAPPGGSYRIPEKGQIQIIIKNENKTALKLFLVPYDLTGMEPGTKTFIRQRSYSAGPIVNNVQGPSELDSPDRPILRYLVHLHVCSPAKGRFYLYKSIRIVFANRVPDGKEKLRNETTWPEPRFTRYKPIRLMHPPLSTSAGPGAMLAADKAFRRRSLGVSFGAQSQRQLDMMDGMDLHSLPAPSGLAAGGGNTAPVDPIPLRFPQRDRPSSEASDASAAVGGLRSPGFSSQASRPSTMDSANGSVSWGATRYEKLTKGDHGYGGNPFGMDGAGASFGAEGLLSQRLKSLGVKTSPTDKDALPPG